MYGFMVMMTTFLKTQPRAVFALLVFSLLAACAKAPATPAPAPAKELIYYDWADDMPQSVFDAFTAEYGVKVTYVTFDSPEEAIANMRAGKAYDVVTMENEYIPALVAEGLLAEIDFRNVPNFKNISADFRDLISDPGNKHTVPFNWGTTGLLAQGELAARHPITRWADLWDPQYSGQVTAWTTPRYLMGISLKSLGYSINSENPAELEAALAHLQELRRNARFSDYDTDAMDNLFVNNQLSLSWGFSGDVERIRQKDADVQYILPEEGVILWGDNDVIPANSPHKAMAELFINFLLRPEISAQFTNQIHYATPNEAARPFVDPAILNDPAIYPQAEALKNAEIIMPLSPQGQKMYDDAWKRFLESAP